MGGVWASIPAMEPRVGAAVIALLGVVISVIISAAISLIVSRRTSYITAVTTQRSKWVDKLRESIAELLGTCGALHMRRDENEEWASGNREKADRLIALITMQLNPKGSVDQNLIQLLALFPAMAEKQQEDYRMLEQAFVQHAQFLLKEEWEKVKFEAMGWSSKPLW